MKKRILLILLSFSAIIRANAQQTTNDKLISGLLAQKDTVAAIKPLLAKLKESDPEKSDFSQLMNVNNQVFDILFKFSSHKHELMAGARYMEHVLEQKINDDRVAKQFHAAWTDTYANLLYKAGEVKKGIEWEERAISDSPDEAQKKEFEANLDKMKKGLPTW